jgi:type IV secretory pathway TrbD component
MNLLKGNNNAVVLVFALLGLSFASYDLILWFLGHAHTLLNVKD